MAENIARGKPGLTGYSNLFSERLSPSLLDWEQMFGDRHFYLLGRSEEWLLPEVVLCDKPTALSVQVCVQGNRSMQTPETSCHLLSKAKNGHGDG